MQSGVRITEGARPCGEIKMYKKMKIRKCSMAAMFLASVSYGSIAQTASAQDAENEQNAPDQNVNDGRSLNVIVVTAERRSEDLQDVAASISAVTGEKLDKLGIRNVNDLANIIPGLNIKSSTLGTTKFNIRGVGQSPDDITVESGVGVFIDDIFLPRMGAAATALFDLERIEVLRGPQGTLYGRNTAGGSINIITKKPGDELEGRFSAEVGNLGTRNFKAYLSGPLVEDRLFAKISAVSLHSDGYVRNIATGNLGNGIDTLAGRVGLRFVASDNVEFTMTADIEKSTPDPTFFSIGPEDGFSTVIHDLLNSFVPPGAPTPFPGEPATGFYETNVDNDGFERLDAWGTMVRADISNSAFETALIFGYRESELVLNTDRDLSPVSLLNESHDEESSWGSAEARFTSNSDGAISLDGKLETTVGLYYFWEDGTRQVDFFNDDVVPFATQGAFDGRATLRFDQAINTKAYAVFGQSTYSVTPSTRLTVGARWTKEEKTAGIATSVMDPLGGNLFGPPNNGGIIAEIFDTETTRQFKDVTLKFGLEQDLGEDILLYATYSEGFKAGGFNGTSPTQAIAQTGFEPEDVISYEAGIKTSFDDRLSVNVSLFKMDYNNLQTAIVSAGGTPFVLNASADLQGGEIEVSAIPFDDLLLNMSVGYVDSEFTEFQNNPGAIGTTVNGIPRWQYSIDATYSVDVGAGEMALQGDYSWESATTTVLQTNVRAAELPSRGLLNFRLGFVPNNGRWEIAGWVRNAADVEYLRSVSAAVSPNSPPGAQSRLPGTPRTYGMSLTFFLD